MFSHLVVFDSDADTDPDTDACDEGWQVGFLGRPRRVG
jgi:hypothetical protein